MCSLRALNALSSCSLATAHTGVFKITVAGPRSQYAQSVLHTLGSLLILSTSVLLGVSSDLPVQVLRLNPVNVTLFRCLLYGLDSVLYTWQFALLGSIFNHFYANRANLASDKTSLCILVVQLGSCTCLALVVSSDVVIRE